MTWTQRSETSSGRSKTDFCPGRTRTHRFRSWMRQRGRWQKLPMSLPGILHRSSSLLMIQVELSIRHLARWSVCGISTARTRMCRSSPSLKHFLRMLAIRTWLWMGTKSLWQRIPLWIWVRPARGLVAMWSQNFSKTRKKSREWSWTWAAAVSWLMDRNQTIPHGK